MKKLIVCLALGVLICTFCSLPSLAEQYGFVTKWGGPGTGDGQFYSPVGVAVEPSGPSGNVYVADSSNNRIQKFNPGGGFLTKWGTYGTGYGQFNGPCRAAVDPSSGDVYVADAYNHRIQKFTSDGAYRGQWGTYGSGNGQFQSPYGVAVDYSGNVYVADSSNHRIQKFNSSRDFITKWGSYGSGDGQFLWPYGVAVDSSGNVYVADLYNARIQKFTSSGEFITKWGTYGQGNGQFSYPQGVAVDFFGNVYVADVGNHRIQKFLSTGAFTTKWGSQGSGNGQFYYPQGVAVDPSGNNVYVADSSNNRIQKFELLANNTPVGTNVTVQLGEITITFSQVTSAGNTAAPATDTGPAIPGTFKLLGKYYDVSTTAVYNGTITASIHYDDAGLTPAKEQKLKLQQYVDGKWDDITMGVDTMRNIITGVTNHLSYFAVMELLNHPPVADAGVAQTVSALTTAFTATAVLDGSASYDPDPDPDHIVEYKWDLGDGNTADGVTVSHQYTALGTYNVTLTVKDTYGETSTATCVVTVNLKAVTPSTEPDKILIPMPTASGELPPGLDQTVKTIYLTKEEFQQYHPVSQGKSPKTGKGFEVYQK